MKTLPKISLILAYLILGTACAQQTENSGELHAALEDDIAIIRNADQVTVGRLNPIAVSDAQANMLKNDETISGYPIVGQIRNLKEQEKTKIIELVLNEKNYLSTRIRCKNEFFIGLRFTRNSEKTEMALGFPCQQVIWAHRVDSEVRAWGAVMDDDATNAIRQIFESTLN